MTDDLETILARVASGELSPEAAEPLVAEAAAPGAGRATDLADPCDRARSTDAGPPMGAMRAVRIRVTDGGRQVVNLRIPVGLASLAGATIPGLADSQVARVQEALRNGEVGTILDVRDADGSGVTIATE